MPEYRPLTWFQGNPEASILTVLDEATRLAFDLTSATEVRMVVKATRETADSAGTTLSTLTGQIVITNAAAGVCRITAPATLTATAGVQWYRIDVINSAGPATTLYGALTITDT